MAGLEQIPMMGRLTQFSGADVATNALNAPLEHQARALQGQQFSDAMLARAVQIGAGSPEAWDAAMQKAAEQGVPEAAGFVGKWNPLTVDRMMSSLQGRTQAPGGVGIEARGRGAAGGGIASAPPDNTDVYATTPDKLKSSLEAINMGLQLLSQPGLSVADYHAGIERIKNLRTATSPNGHPEAEKFKTILNDLNLANPETADKAIRELRARLEGGREQIAQRLGPETLGLPERTEDVTTQMSEAGPINIRRPVGGGPASADFAPVRGDANPAFLQAARGGAATRPPSGYFWGPPGEDGQPTLLPVSGGPADKAGKRLLTQAMTSDLSAMGDKYAAVQKSAGTFKDEYASLGVGGRGGETALLAGRTLGVGASQNAIDWWQTYDKYKAEVRNKLYGAALTPGEEANFEKADINANMLAKTITANLKTQQDIIEAALRRRGKSLAVQGYNTEAIEVLTGLPLDEAEIDAGVGNTTDKITATPTGAGAGDGAALSVPRDAAMFRQGAVYQVRTPAEYKMLPAGTRYIDPNGRRGTKR